MIVVFSSLIRLFNCWISSRLLGVERCSESSFRRHSRSSRSSCRAAISWVFQSSSCSSETGDLREPVTTIFACSPGEAATWAPPLKTMVSPARALLAIELPIMFPSVDPITSGSAAIRLSPKSVPWRTLRVAALAMALAAEVVRLAAMLRAERSDNCPAPNDLPSCAPMPPPSPAAAIPAKSNFFCRPTATPMPCVSALPKAPRAAPATKPAPLTIVPGRRRCRPQSRPWRHPSS